MFGDLDKTLENLLKQNLDPDLLKSVAISFDPPDGKFPPAWVKLPAINLFLYMVLENLELRSTEWTWEKGRADDGVVKKPQTQIECFYIMTVWTSESSPNHMLEEHRLLGEAMKALLKGRSFPREMLYGSLKDGTATIIRAEALQPEHFNMGPFWQAIGVKPRVAVNYQITLSVDVHTPEKTKEVKARELKLIDSQGAENAGERTRFDTSGQPGK